MTKSLLLRNSAANMSGRLVAAGSNVIAAPIIIHAIGREGFGVVAFALSFVVLASLLDVGLAATANRAIAQAPAGGRGAGEQADLLRTFELIYWAGAAAIIVATLAMSGWVARDWLRLSALGPSDAAFVVVLIGIMLGLRFPVGLYSGVLYGLRQHVTQNMIFGGFSAVRSLGGAALVVFVSPSVVLYSKWLALTGLAEMLVAALVAWGALGGRRSFVFGRFQGKILAQHWRFSLVFGATGAMWTLVASLDRIFLGKMLPASELGLYGLLYTPAGAVAMVGAALSLAAFPEFAAATASGATFVARQLFMRTQLLATSCIIGIVVPLAIHFRPILRIWTRDASIARDGFLPGLMLLSALAINAIADPAYTFLVASGRPRIVLWRNLSALVVAGAGLALLIPLWGLSGAAAAMLITNAFGQAYLLARAAKILAVDSISLPILAALVLAFILLCAANVAIAIVFDRDLLRVIMGGIVSAIISGGLVFHLQGR